MSFLLPFFIGVLASVIGTLLPGILNASVVKIYKEEGIKNTNSFISGSFVIIALQTYLAVFFARIIDRSEFITSILREIGLVVFLILTIYFFAVKPRKKLDEEMVPVNKRRRFLHGMALAVINVFPVFYYVFITISVLNNNIYEVYYLSNIQLTVGVLSGTYLVFLLYIRLFRKSNPEESYILRNINRIIGCITGIVAIFNLYKIITS